MTSSTANTTTTTSHCRVGLGAGAWSIVSDSGSRYGYWATPQPQTMARHRQRPEQARRSTGVSSEQDQRGDAAHARQQDQHPAALRERLEHERLVGAQHEHPDHGHQPGHDRGADGPVAEIVFQIRVGQPMRVGDQEDGRQIGSHGNRQHADQDPGRVEPAGHQVAGRVADRHPTRDDARR